MTTVRYSLPPLDQAWLVASLKDMFPAHKTSHEMVTLVHDLVHAYMIWWMLMVTFPKRRIVGTGPLWQVRQIHATDLERFFADCFDYLGRIPTKKELWGGPLDFRGTHDTARSLKEVLDFPDLVWEPILQTATAQRVESIIRLH